MTPIFETNYHTIMGLAKKPGQNAYFSWINSTTLFYGAVNLDTKNITACANSDAVNVSPRNDLQRFLCSTGPEPAAMFIHGRGLSRPLAQNTV